MNVTRATTRSVKLSGTRGVRRLVAVGLLIGAGLATSAAPAAAAPVPSSCAWGMLGVNGSWASCNAGNGAFRAWVQCRHSVWPNGYYINYGPWEVPGQGINSTVYCGSTVGIKDSRQSYGIQYS